MQGFIKRRRAIPSNNIPLSPLCSLLLYSMRVARRPPPFSSLFSFLFLRVATPIWWWWWRRRRVFVLLLLLHVLDSSLLLEATTLVQLIFYFLFDLSLSRILFHSSSSSSSSRYSLLFSSLFLSFFYIRSKLLRTSERELFFTLYSSVDATD